jgi:DNA mismatch endonuclease (patch repair protein)
MDNYTKEKRSQIMSRVKSRDTSIEVLVRKYLFQKGLRFRKNVKELPGKPDIVLKKYNSIIFVHGCFWHGHVACCPVLPKTRAEFWRDKIDTNRARDFENSRLLQELGWKVINVWQCELKNKTVSYDRLSLLERQIRSNEFIE